MANADTPAPLTGVGFLRKLQEESDHGFHRELRSWVDEESSVARVLRRFDSSTA